MDIYIKIPSNKMKNEMKQKENKKKIAPATGQMLKHHQQQLNKEDNQP